MIKCMFYTRAYNAAGTLRRTIDSIIAQTEKDWVYYVCDNGSLDSTGDIILEYADKDERVKYLHNNKNNVWEDKGNLWENIVRKYEYPYTVWLDADDAYYPDFLEKMLAFVKENNLDVASCGNDFINARTNKLDGIRKLNQNLILEGGDFDIYFTTYHQFMRTKWGKIYSLSLLQKYDYKKFYDVGKKISYGMDTLLCMRAFLTANRAGILAESLYKYYVSPASHSYKFNNKRIASDRVLHDEAVNYLIEKAGYVSARNREFLFAVYFNAIRDTLNVLLNAQISVDEKLNGMRDIFTSEQTLELSNIVFSEYGNINAERRGLFNELSDWILSEKESCKNNMETAAAIFTGMNIIPMNMSGWSNAEAFALLTLMPRKSYFNGGLDGQITAIASRQPLLKRLSAEFLIFFRDIVIAVLDNDFNSALTQILSIIKEEREISGDLGIEFATLGLKLSAALEIEEHFIFFKKKQVSLLLEAGQKEKAAAELADYDALMPTDEDFKELRKRLAQ